MEYNRHRNSSNHSFRNSLSSVKSNVTSSSACNTNNECKKTSLDCENYFRFRLNNLVEIQNEDHQPATVVESLPTKSKQKELVNTNSELEQTQSEFVAQSDLIEQQSSLILENQHRQDQNHSRNIERITEKNRYCHNCKSYYSYRLKTCTCRFMENRSKCAKCQTRNVNNTNDQNCYVCMQKEVQKMKRERNPELKKKHSLIKHLNSKLASIDDFHSSENEEDEKYDEFFSCEPILSSTIIAGNDSNTEFEEDLNETRQKKINLSQYSHDLEYEWTCFNCYFKNEISQTTKKNNHVCMNCSCLRHTLKHNRNGLCVWICEKCSEKENPNFSENCLRCGHFRRLTSRNTFEATLNALNRTQITDDEKNHNALYTLQRPEPKTRPDIFRSACDNVDRTIELIRKYCLNNQMKSFHDSTFNLYHILPYLIRELNNHHQNDSKNENKYYLAYIRNFLESKSNINYCMIHDPIDLEVQSGHGSHYWYLEGKS
jgi:hypothetical protein